MRSSIAVLCGLALVVTLAGRAHADDAEDDDAQLYSCAKGSKDKVWVNLKPGTELDDLVGWAMTFTCKNFVVSSRVRGHKTTVTIVAPEQLTPRDAWKTFLVALQSMNLTVVPKGKVLEIVEAPSAKEAALPVYTPESVTSTDQIVRVVLRPSYIPVDDLATALTAVKSKDGAIVALPQSGMLVVTDYGSTIARMLPLMREVDAPLESEKVYVIQIEHADAQEVASTVTELLGTGMAAPAPAPRRGKAAPAAEPATALPTKLLADKRTNALIMIGDEPAYARVQAIVRYLDLPNEAGAGKVHVYPLAHADATELATTLAAILQAGASGAGAAAKPGKPVELTGDIRVVADKPTNALIVWASVRDFLALRDVIRELDVPRRQVFIEATILEVSDGGTRELGASGHFGSLDEDGGLGFGSMGFGGISTIALPELLGSGEAASALPAGAVGGYLGPIVPGMEELLGISIPSFGVLFQALATSSFVNIVSAPSVIAMDNKEATISIGENIPYKAGYTETSNVLAGSVSVQREKVALTLKITPHIGVDGTVRLDIRQEIKDVGEKNFGGLGPSWSEKEIETAVVVRDREAVIIGGLMQERTEESENKVPLLGDIPVVGHLFRSTYKSKRKTNLIVVITPYVLEDETDLQELRDRKLRERAEFFGTFRTFETLELDPTIDPRRKRGVVEEINKQVLRVEDDKKKLAAE